MRIQRIYLCFLICGLGIQFSFGQSSSKVLKADGMHKMWTVDFSKNDEELQMSGIWDNELAPKPLMRSAELKKTLDARRKAELRLAYKNSPYREDAESAKPMVEKDFNGKPLGSAGIPNDNSMAISNDGIIISAINSTISILDSNGNLLKFRTLAGIVAGQLGILDRFYDPKVLYDPVTDRFILVFLEGSLSDDTRIIVGFTQTNDPTGIWKFYQLDGNPLGGTNWSDYPIIAHNKEDLYITVNLLRDNESWQEGFLQSFIWQINKADGYSGQSLTQNLFYDIEFEGKPVWSICPVQPAVDFERTDMYFLSVRPDAESNDTVFLHYINNSAKSGIAEHSLKVLKTDLAYGVAPSAPQPIEGFMLQTNDTRVLSATLFDKEIHYVQTCIAYSPMASGIYHGVLRDPEKNTVIIGNIIRSDGLDLAYPSISYSGITGTKERSMLITFSHVGINDYPGTSILFHNRFGGLHELYSNVIMVKQGDSLINTFAEDSLERWGDYTDLQRKYNEEGVVWICGSYGDSNGVNNVYIAKIRVNNELQFVESMIVYPNPAHSRATVATGFESAQTVSFMLVDSKGDIVKRKDQLEVPAGHTEFSIELSGLVMGVYHLVIVSEEGEVLHRQKIIVN